MVYCYYLKRHFSPVVKGKESEKLGLVQSVLAVFDGLRDSTVSTGSAFAALYLSQHLPILQDPTEQVLRGICQAEMSNHVPHQHW